ncbi:MAG: hypothetical protein WAQ27_06120 [Candidatus Microsaccharimonas sp.]
MVKLGVQTLEQPEAIANHEMIVKLHSQYQYDRVVAIREVSKIQRELTRAEHEMHRLEQHLARIEDFCKKNNITLED